MLNQYKRCTMSVCPVCKTECGESTTCNICGFNDVNRIFINRDEAFQWEISILLPYKNQYFSKLDIEKTLKISGNRVVKYLKRSKTEYVIIPNYITRIAPDAFQFCSGIKEIYIPDSVTELPPQTFLGCESLETVRLSENLTHLPDGVFSGCSNLKEITIPAKIQNINPRTFDRCFSLKYIRIAPNNQSIKIIGNCLVSGNELVKVIADEDIDTLVIPEGIKSINRGPFGGYYNVKSIDFPETLEYIGLHAFWGLDKLEIITIPKNVYHIGANAFAKCDSLRQVVVDDANKTFRCQGNCIIENDEIIQGFPSSEIPKDYSVRRIAAYAFTNVKRNSPIFIPHTIEYIDDGAFEGEFDIFCDTERKPAGWNENWCNRYHKGKVFFIRNDGCKMMASREQIEGKR